MACVLQGPGSRAAMGQPPLEAKQQQRGQMEEEVKDVNRPMELAVFQHDDLFHHVRHGMKRRQQHENRKDDQNRKGKLVEELEHGQILALSRFAVRTSSLAMRCPTVVLCALVGFSSLSSVLKSVVSKLYNSFSSREP